MCPCRRADVVDSSVRGVDKPLGFDAGGALDPDRQIEQLACPTETNDRAALQCLAAARAQKLGIGVEESRSQNIQGELRRAGGLLDAGGGSENVSCRTGVF